MTKLEIFLVIAECFIILNGIIQTAWFLIWYKDRKNNQTEKLLKEISYTNLNIQKNTYEKFRK